MYRLPSDAIEGDPALPARDCYFLTVYYHSALFFHSFTPRAMKKPIFISLLLAFFGLTACNTWSGLGKDLQTVGRKIEDAGNRR